MSDIDLTEAVEAAGRGFCGDLVPPVGIDDLSAIQRHVIREQALSYVTHALPHIERQVREQVAREIEAGLPEARRRREGWIQQQQPDRVLGYTAAIDAMETCARVARGEHL